MVITIFSCEEVYTPEIDHMEGQLVVESLITNDTTRNYVHLTTTTSFYNRKTSEVVTGAKVSLIDVNGKIVPGVENTPGWFNFNVIPESGEKYLLQIIYNNHTYESDMVTMPPIPSIIDFYTGHTVVNGYFNDGYGNPVPYELSGREIYVDVPLTAELSYYRFETRSVLQWSYLPPETGPPPPPPPPQVYGWTTYYGDEGFNIAGLKRYSQSNVIDKQSLMILPYEARQLLDPDSIPHGWIVILDLYGTSPDSYDFHEKLNSQFNASGTLFDPIETQIFGNIRCTTDTSRIVFGYFDLNSYSQYRYYLLFYSDSTDVIQRQIFRYPYISDHGQNFGTPPDWWE